MAKKPAAKRKTKQPFLDGMEPPTIPELDDAAENYYDVMQERVALSRQEDEAKDNLIDKMKAHKLDRYETADGKVVMVVNKSNVRVKPKKADSNGEAGL